MSQNKQTQVILTTGQSDPERALLGLQAAVTAIASGVETSVFLTLDATIWACDPPLPEADEVYQQIDALTAMGGTVTCCSACALEQCSVTEVDDEVVMTMSPPSIATRHGIQLVGLATLMERVASGIPTVTF